MSNKLKVEIWSDIACPFCYIGKREFERALESFPEKDNLEIEWKSYQLDPDQVTTTDKTVSQYLAETKGMPLEAAEEMGKRVTERAAEVGLDYHFERVIPANTMKAHNFIHFAKKFGKQNEAEELLFSAYFVEGKNVDDVEFLMELATRLGLDAAQLKIDLDNNTYYDDVRADIYDAFQVGVRGVPFFVFDRKYAVSGAQPNEVFVQTIQKSYDEWKKSQNRPLTIQEGDSCDIDGNCN